MAKNVIGATLILSSDLIGTDENNFSNNLLLTGKLQVFARLLHVINWRILNSQKLRYLSKIIQLGGFLGRFLGLLLKVALPLVKNVLQPLAKSVLMIPLGLTVAATAAEVGIHKKILGSGTTALVISNEEMKDIMKIVQSLEDAGLLLKGITKTIENETK